MPKCTDARIEFGRFGRRVIEADFNGGDLSSDGGLLQTAVGRDEALASAPTFSRLENRATRAQAWAMHEVLASQFIASFDEPPAELVLDIDASDVPLHGQQELSQFHAYYERYCYLPLYVFCAASSATRPRAGAVITRLEYGSQGTNPRFLVTNLEGEPDALYVGLYCQRGEAENRINATARPRKRCSIYCKATETTSIRPSRSSSSALMKHPG